MTVQILMVAGVLVLYFFLFYMVGSLVLHFFPADGDDIRLSYRLIIGFFTYHFLFTILALPMKFLLLPLSWLSAAWAGVLIILTVLFFILERKLFAERFRDGRKTLHIGALLLMLGIIILQVICFNLNDETYAIWDQSYYLGDTATSLYTNTISQYNPYTGNPLSNLDREYLLETFQNHSAVMCQLLHIHPMIEVLTVMGTVVIILYQLIFYEIGMVLFQKNRLKSAVMVCFLFLLNFFSYNLFTAAEFLIIRPSEGKTVLAVLIIPALLWLFLKTAREPENRIYWTHTFFIILGAFGLNMSSIFMIPFEISAFYIPLAIKKKKGSIFLGYLILMIPCIIFAAAYVITKKYIIIRIES